MTATTRTPQLHIQSPTPPPDKGQSYPRPLERVRPRLLLESKVVPMLRQGSGSMEDPPLAYGKLGGSLTPPLVRRKGIPKPVHRRNQSEPLVGSSRRSIFGEFWIPKSPLNTIAPFSPPSTSTRSSHTAARSSSICIPDRLPCAKETFRHFTPPASPTMDREYYKRVDQIPASSLEGLPEIPYPLQRFYKGKKRPSLGGVYPMNSPPSIVKESSFGKSFGENLAHLEKSPTCVTSSDAHHPSPIEASFNLTQSCTAWDEEKGDAETSSSSGSCSRRSRRVQFDPRVTVTEYADGVPRRWMSEVELERAKYNTIGLAQRYLLSHPEMIDVYNTPKLDPVTGTMRKRPLFSLPVFSEADEADSAEAERERIEMKVIADNEVRNVLLVDPNQKILELFERSLQSLFPRAQFTTAESGEEALCAFQHSMHGATGRRCFDIVITEERLHRLKATELLTSSATQSDHHLEDLSDGVTNERLLVKRPSHPDLSTTSQTEWVGMSGSVLIKKIMALEDSKEPFVSRSAAIPMGSGASAPSTEQSLFIGVSAHPDKVSKVFLDNGADIVWGKPPPCMNEILRDHIVSSLIKKRRAQANHAHLTTSSRRHVSIYLPGALSL